MSVNCATCHGSFAETQLEYTEAGLTCQACRIDQMEAEEPLTRHSATERVLMGAGVALVLARGITMRSNSTESSSITVDGQLIESMVVSLSADLPGLVFGGAGVALALVALISLLKFKATTEDPALRAKLLRSKAIYGAIAALILLGSAYELWDALPRTITMG